MNSHLSRRAGLVCSGVLLVGLVPGCGASATDDGASATDDGVAGPAMTDLAPSYDAQPTEQARAQRGKQEQTRRTGRPGAGRTPTAGSRSEPADSPAPTLRRGPRASLGVVAADPGPVRIADPEGDLGGGLEGAHASADIVAVQLGLTGATVEVRHTFAGPVPARREDGRGMNVASFYDVDGNGIVDHEVWVSLADDGWGTGHLDRREREASFGPSTGIEVSVEGDTLVTRFPVERIGGVDVFRWSAASEWGSYESMAASTSARDFAPDEGAVRYPG